MSGLKYIGLWIEDLKDQCYFPPQAFVGGLDPSDKEMLIEYLTQGEIYEQYRGYSWCRFGCGADGPEMGSCELNDGEWVWPQGLSHYIREHDVRLPDSFISHIKKNKGKPINGIKRADLVDERPSDKEWAEWCRQEVPESIVIKLAKAKEAADKKYIELRKVHFRKREAEVGLSKAICIYQGCENHALKEIIFCAECANKIEAIDPGNIAYSGILDVINS